MKNWRNILKIGLLIIGVVFIAPAFLGFSVSENSAENTNGNNPAELSSMLTITPTPAQEIAFEVSGQVKNPGVFMANSDLLVNDAIKLAGGYTDQADLDYVYRNILLAVPVAPGQKIFIPKKGETPEAGVAVPEVSQNGKININTASNAVLDQVPGVGPATIEKIISGRPYRSCSDIDSIKGVNSTVKSTLKEKCII